MGMYIGGGILVPPVRWRPEWCYLC